MRGNAGSNLTEKTTIWKLHHLAQTSQNCFLAKSCLTAVQLPGSRISPLSHCCCKNICGWIFASSKQDGKNLPKSQSQGEPCHNNLHKALAIWREVYTGNLYWEVYTGVSGGEMLENTLGAKLKPTGEEKK